MHKQTSAHGKGCGQSKSRIFHAAEWSAFRLCLARIEVASAKQDCVTVGYKCLRSGLLSGGRARVEDKHCGSMRRHVRSLGLLGSPAASPQPATAAVNFPIMSVATLTSSHWASTWPQNLLINSNISLTLNTKQARIVLEGRVASPVGLMNNVENAIHQKMGLECIE